MGQHVDSSTHRSNSGGYCRQGGMNVGYKQRGEKICSCDVNLACSILNLILNTGDSFSPRYKILLCMTFESRSSRQEIYYLHKSLKRP